MFWAVDKDQWSSVDSRPCSHCLGPRAGRGIIMRPSARFRRRYRPLRKASAWRPSPAGSLHSTISAAPTWLHGPCRHGTYEAPLPIMVMAHVFRTQGLFLEVGANNGLGMQSLPPRRALMPGSWLSNPMRPAREAMLTNLVLNDLVERVIVHDVALSDSAGEAVLHVPDSSHGSLETKRFSGSGI